MRKIFQLISSIQLGGAENVAFDLAEHCAKELKGDHEITVVELYGTLNDYAHSKKEELISKNIRVITLYNGSKRASLLFAPLFLLRLIKREKPVIIHSHTDLPDFVLAVAIRLARFLRINIPRIARTIHNTQLWRTHHKLGKFTESTFGNESVVSVSSYAMIAYEQLRKKYGLPISSNRQIIYNGCDIPEQCSHPFRIDPARINIAFCGRFEDYKGMGTLIPAIPEIEHLFPERFLFHLIGDGSYKKELQKLVRENNNVHLYDPVPNVSTMFYVFDYLWMPSHFEGLTLISIEASFSGVPVIASFAPGLDETLPENWPLKFHLNNEEELYNIFDKIDNNLYDREALKKMANDFVSKNFSRDKMIYSYNVLYNNML